MPTPDDAYRQLAGFLADDPDNAALIADTARAALAAGEADAAETLARRHDAVAGAGPDMAHLRGLIAMARRDWAAAAAQFARLIDLGVDAVPVRFNLAWSRAMAGDGDAALPLLDDTVAAAMPQAAQLLVGLLHERGDLDAAEAAARAAIARFPDHGGLNAIVSTLAIDIEDMDLARIAAARGGSHAAALVTRGVLALDADRTDEARALFDAVLARDPGNGRAGVGKGLLALNDGAYGDAAAALDRAAATFGTHPGSWIAAGWACLLGGDRDGARDRFARALAIDDGFAESHGALAVLDLMAGDVDGGRRRADVARRLDPHSFAAALAAAMLAAGAGDPARAQRIVTLALATPIDGTGRTIAQALARIAPRA